LVLLCRKPLSHLSVMLSMGIIIRYFRFSQRAAEDPSFEIIRSMNLCRFTLKMEAL